MAAPEHLKFLGQPQAFDYAWLKGHARQLAGQPYQLPENHIPPEVKALDWDQYEAIGYRDDHVLLAKGQLRFQVKFFHLGLFFKSPVQI